MVAPFSTVVDADEDDCVGGGLSVPEGADDIIISYRFLSIYNRMMARYILTCLIRIAMELKQNS